MNAEVSDVQNHEQKQKKEICPVTEIHFIPQINSQEFKEMTY